jgi:hypothetical protein
MRNHDRFKKNELHPNKGPDTGTGKNFFFLNMSIFMLKFAALIGTKMSYVWSAKLHQNFKYREENSFPIFPDYVVKRKSQEMAHVVRSVIL